MIDFIYSLGNALSEGITKVFFDDSGKCNTLGGCFLVFAGVMLLLGVILKVFKFFSLRCKDESSLEENIEPKKVDIQETSVLVSSHKVPLVSRFSCCFCGSITTTDSKNCRNCGSDEFEKVGD